MAIECRYSKHNATAGDQGAGTAALSLGKYCGNSASVIPDGTLNNLFADESGGADRTDYRCLFLVNTGTVSETDVALWIASQVALGATVTVAMDPTECCPVDQSGTWQTGFACTSGGSADETEAPRDSGLTPISYTFASPADLGTALSMGQIPAGYAQAVWLKRVVTTGTSPLANDGVTLTGQSTHTI